MITEKIKANHKYNTIRRKKFERKLCMHECISKTNLTVERVHKDCSNFSEILLFLWERNFGMVLTADDHYKY